MRAKIPASGIGHGLLLGGKIIFNERSSVMDCTVRALSKDSAELRLPNTLSVPRAFELVVKPHNKTYACEVVWRSATDMGVIFAREGR
ncbi:MAG: PilZ domain-containing protein [Hyphomicrobium sp.]|nr:PilZ domain-containing protein [Hyphomicrobium sp.]